MHKNAETSGLKYRRYAQNAETFIHVATLQCSYHTCTELRITAGQRIISDQ